MSVIVTVRVSADPGVFAETLNAEAETIGRIIEIAKSNGLIAHRWYGGEGESMAIDEWPDPESFQAFFEEAGPHIGPVMQAAGVTAPPTVSFWRKLDVDDEVGWGA